ncbi:MAG: hypothetical protein K0U86_14580 [Planctomycetes bacterium]|nr:hypothetical protein [Planctomycetota bacterium]MCH9726122.1 hypothetical protein [Planctomycetota bacterium]MCH9777274.1 hypothetical protein [Planctomycetota bacterium]MCH9790592.1 hypothetical protein [Planctomycetota bacterium]
MLLSLKPLRFYFLFLIFLFSLVPTPILCAEPDVLSGTEPLTETGDFSVKMAEGISRYLLRATENSVAQRKQYWQRNFLSPENYAKSVEPNRRRFQKIIGAIDARIPSPEWEYVSGPDSPAVVAETTAFQIRAVRWPVLPGVSGEGLLIEPHGNPVANLIIIPDADQTPEMLVGLTDSKNSHFNMLPFANSGCRILIPQLINRECTWSGNPDISMTNITHREWIYRQAYEMGRHIIGLEVLKMRSAVDLLTKSDTIPVGIAGYGEGGLIALYTSALDQRIKSTLVSGYFNQRNRLWTEPMYRNVFGLLREFGDAEIASLITPRTLVIEQSRAPEVAGPPEKPANRRPSAAPGALVQPADTSVKKEVERARSLIQGTAGPMGIIDFVYSNKSNPVEPISHRAYARWFKSLGYLLMRPTTKNETLKDARTNFDPAQRQERQVAELVNHCQKTVRKAEQIRAKYWKPAQPTGTPEEWAQKTKVFKKRLWEELTGKLPDPEMPLAVKSRKINETKKYTTYEIKFDVWPDVFAWGYLLVPKGIAAGEKRPVVVCQHGLEGLPDFVVNDIPKSPGYRSYRGYATRLAERGFITYAPHNPYRGKTLFRQNQRKAGPLGLTLYSFIMGQHQRMLGWLGSLPHVDANRIGFYGLSYGGLSAVRIPSLLDGYALSVCSACFNDWTRKITTLDFRAAYMFTNEYDHFQFNLGSTFNHAEMASLISPRPFMVERGHQDGVAPDEWVAYEYAKVRRHYAALGIPERTEIEFFTGGHIIQGQGTFDFLHKHLDWPKEAK